MYCEMEERALLNRSRTEDEESATEPPAAAKLGRHVRQQPATPFSMPDWDVGSSSNGEGNNSNKKFDVFLSHRGPDTKHTLAIHMYDVLRLKGIEAFLDKQELESGERVWTAIEEAITCCNVYVCILSTGYAQSESCLRELEMMLDNYEMDTCRKKLIHDVKPSDVRYLQGAFGQGFQSLKQKERYKDSSQVLDNWTKALSKVAEIKGHEGKGELCTTIVDIICKQLFDVGAVATSVRGVGRQEQLRSIIQDINRHREDGLGVTSVEISGIGGIGKTTFAKELYNWIYKKYDRSCFIEDAKGLVEKHGINEVHKQLIGKLFKYDPSDFRIETKKLLRDRLQDADILIVIDNIDSKIPLSTVFIEDDVYLKPTSIIVVTSREEGVLKHDRRVAKYRKNFIPVQLVELDFCTSKKIFCEYAFEGIDNVKSDFNGIIDKIVDKCHGIPLALTLLARQVEEGDIQSLKKLWKLIENFLHPEVKDILEVSYNNLTTELEKCLFLDVATFLRWEKVDLLLQLRQSDYEDDESKVAYALDILKRKLLIKVDKGGFLNMHDLLVDLGRSLIHDEDSCPGRRSRVWHPSDVKHMLSHRKGTSKVEALCLYGTGTDGTYSVLNEDGCPWYVDAFSGMSSLKFLLLDGYCIEGDLSKLSRRLRWLRWTNYPYQCMPPPTLCLQSMRLLQLSRNPLTPSLNPNERVHDAKSFFNQLLSNTRLLVNLLVLIWISHHLLSRITVWLWQKSLPQ